MSRSVLPWLERCREPLGRIILCGLATVMMGGCSVLPSSPGAVSAEADRRAIVAHIERIFQAYVDRDRQAIRDSHTTDWTGFQGPSRRIERGVDDYMVNADRSLSAFRGTGFELLDTEVRVHGDLALVYYIARYDYLDAANQPTSLGLRALDVYRRERGEWIQSGSHITPVPDGGVWGEGTVRSRR